MERLTDSQAVSLLKDGDIIDMAQQADKVRQQMHPGNIVTFIIDRNINYTNICVNECNFCAFYRRSSEKGAYLLSIDDVLKKVDETVAAGGTQIMLQGGLHPDVDFQYYIDMLTAIKKKYDITIHSFTATEILHFSKITGYSVTEVLKRLQAAGLSSLPGGGAEILVDRVRKIVSPKKIMTSDWLNIMRCAHNIGMKTTATMVLGLGETIQERIEHMNLIRSLQEETGGFRAFIMWTFQPGNTKLGGKKLSSWDYLKTLAVSRLYLDNISHIQGSWVTQGKNIGQMTLAFGADDLGSIMLEENVVRAAGTSHQMSVNTMSDIIKKADKIPAQRDTAYNILRYCN
ncbi:cyclic dehypoxanthinyl futalosine synthase [Pectinatus frisingensis]|jgi:cyclic dehypoxanthinyl futalosine synthase|uniref:cyclic dehypoxanthinyl futalosine synthase n=1 Tax=Pectinatus frisingensis TaxID=865 RepID=UPI0015F39C32|nr:cyclic dehypoxanthinyl futalosine synthase [Pectinatus frisingensis]